MRTGENGNLQSTFWEGQLPAPYALQSHHPQSPAGPVPGTLREQVASELFCRHMSLLLPLDQPPWTFVHRSKIGNIINRHLLPHHPLSCLLFSLGRSHEAVANLTSNNLEAAPRWGGHMLITVGEGGFSSMISRSVNLLAKNARILAFKPQAQKLFQRSVIL